jgi:subtilisin family serine protease
MQATPSSKVSKFTKLAALSLATGACAAGAATVDPDLSMRMARDQGGNTRYPVIIHLAKQADPAEISQRVASLPQGQRGGRLLEALRAFNKPLQAALVQDLGARKAQDVVPLVMVNAVAAHVSARDVREISQRAEVGSIRYDIGLLAPSRQAKVDPCKPARPTPRSRLPKSCRQDGAKPPVVVAGVPFDPALGGSPAIQAIGAPAAWKAGLTGKGVTVAVIDTGVDGGQPDLVGSFRGGKADWFDVHGEQVRPIDKHGHGTQITGVVVGTGASGQTLGVAPQAHWIAARLYNNENIGRLSQIHRIMEWVLDPDGNPNTADAPQVVLNSWGLGDRPGTCDQEFAADIRWLRAAGMHVVFAAGNRGPADNTSVSPANNKGALAVGALDTAGELAHFTSHGVSACDARPYPDLLAPGELLRTTDISFGALPITTYGTGTSFAAAVVAGELALLLQAKPKLTTAERETLLAAAPGDKRPTLNRALDLPATAEKAQ